MNPADYDGITREKRDILDLFKKYDIINTDYHILSHELNIDFKKAAGIPILFDLLTTIAAKRINNYDQIIGMAIGSSYNDYGAIYAYTIGMKVGIPTVKWCAYTNLNRRYFEGNLIRNSKNVIAIDDQIDKERVNEIDLNLEHLVLRGNNIKSLLILAEDETLPVRKNLESKNIKVISLFTKQKIIDYCGKSNE